MSIVLSSKQMKDMDQRTIGEFGLPARLLMENAGKGCADYLISHFPEALKGQIIILHGSGNNSGDGFVIARWLHNRGYSVILMQVQDGQYSPESLANKELCSKLQVPQYHWQNESNLCSQMMQSASTLIDAVFGIGFRGELPSGVAEAFSLANGCSALRIAIDIASGIDANTGIAAPSSFQAHHSLAIHARKTGQLLHSGKRLSGDLHLIPIGIPPFYDQDMPHYELISEDSCSFPIRDPQAHKGNYGKVFIMGGSAGYTGSVALSATAALRSGAGYVYLCSRQELEQNYCSLTPELMFRPFPHITNFPELDLESYAEYLEAASAILIGPGLGLDSYAKSVLDLVLSVATVPVIIDADAISLIAADEDLQEHLQRENIILTPHPGEFSRISGISREQLKADTVSTLREFCANSGLRVLLKGDTSIFCDPQRLIFNISGNDALATGGSGDVLGGIIASFIAQGMEPGLAAINASFLMGCTAAKLAEKRGTPGIIPSDIIANLFC